MRAAFVQDGISARSRFLRVIREGFVEEASPEQALKVKRNLDEKSQKFEAGMSVGCMGGGIKRSRDYEEV